MMQAQVHEQAPQIVAFPGQWSPFRQAGCCPRCGAWVKVGKTGKVMPPVGHTRVRYLYCECGENFKATEVDETVIS